VKVGTNFVPLTPTVFVFYNSSLVVFVIIFTYVFFAFFFTFLFLLFFFPFFVSFLVVRLGRGGLRWGLGSVSVAGDW